MGEGEELRVGGKPMEMNYLLVHDQTGRNVLACLIKHSYEIEKDVTIKKKCRIRPNEGDYYNITTVPEKVENRVVTL